MTDVPDRPIKQHPLKSVLTGPAKTTKKIIKHSMYASPLGNLHIQHNGQSIQHIQYINLHTTESSPLSVTPLPARWAQLLDHYFCGDFSALDHLPVRLDQGTAFQQQVWLALRKIKAGHTWSYKALAQRIKRPNAVRAVGQALSRNPVVIVLPCHRVIQQSGALGGYEGHLAASSGRKQFLLWHEGADMPVARHKSNIDQI